MENKTLILDIGSYSIKYGMGRNIMPTLIKSKHIIINSIINDKNKFNNIINNILLIENVDTILICEPVNTSDNYRQLINNYFSKYKIKYINQQLLALYSFGKDKGLVIDIGYNTKIVAFYDSYLLDYLYIKHIKNDDELIENISSSLNIIIQKIAIDLRKDIIKNIYIIGYNNINDIALKLLKELSPKYSYHLTVPKNNKFATWFGGSILSNVNFSLI